MSDALTAQDDGVLSNELRRPDDVSQPVLQCTVLVARAN